MRTFSFQNASRIACAVAGTAAWLYWLSAGNRLSPPAALSVWSSALLLWGMALASRWPARRPDRWTVLVVLILAAAIIPRVVDLENAPYSIALDEIIDPFLGLQVLRQHPWAIMSGVSKYFATPYLTQVLGAWPCLFLKPLLGARVASMVIGMLSLAATYALARHLFGRTAAFVALVVLAGSFWQIAYSRMGYPYVQPLLFVPLALFASIKGFEQRNLFLQFLGGVVLATSVLVYTPARIAVPIFLAWLVHQVAIRRVRLREAAVGLLLIGVAMVIVLSPYVRREGFAGFTQRYRETSMGELGPLHLFEQRGWVTPEGRRLMAAQLRRASAMYYEGGAEIALHDVVRRPLVDWVTLGLALLGLVIAAFQLRDGGCFLLLVWVSLTFVLGQVFTDVPTAAYRAGPLLPALAIAAGLTGREIANFVDARAGRREVVRIAGVLGLAAVVTPVNLSYLDAYLARRGGDPVTAMARLIGKSRRGAVYYLVTSIESYADHQVFRFLGDGRDIEDVPSLMDALGKRVDERHDAVFVLGPDMAGAVSVIQRCYPGSSIAGETTPEGTPVLSMGVTADALRAGHGCSLPRQGPGLEARYFAGPAWDGAAVRERLEDWPFPQRWKGDGNDGFKSVEWDGFIRLPVSGSYRFQWLVGGDSEAGALGELTIGSAVHLERQGQVEVRLAAGVYPIRARYRPRGRRAYCWLRWAPPGGVLQAIPPQFLLPPCWGKAGGCSG